MRFPLKDWIDEHPGCRHTLAESGMHGSIRGFAPSRIRFDRSVLAELEAELGRHLGVDAGRIFLTHGATEANALVVAHLARRPAGRRPTARVKLPEYPPLVDLLALERMRLVGSSEPADLAVVSRPRNPTGEFWSAGRLEAWASGAQNLLVDETFLQFAGAPSVARRGARGVWATGTFTKFFGADHLRVGYAVAPPEEAAAFRHRFGLVVDELAPASAAGAVALLRSIERVRAEVRAVVDANVAALRSVLPALPRPVAPLFFDHAAGDGNRLATACLRASVLVCPGRFFGDPRGVRVCLTRRTFPRDLEAYRAVRDRFAGSRRGPTEAPKDAPPHRAAGGRGGVGRT